MRVSEIAGPRRIDLNVDVGEGFPYDALLLDFASSANICCGAHAGSRDLTLATVALCREKGARVGAHPGYPDRASMGRAPLDLDHRREYLRSLFDQVAWFVEVAHPAYVKPHGGFYNDTGVRLPTDWESQMRGASRGSPYEVAGVYLAQIPGLHSLQMLLRVHRLSLLGLAGTAHEVVAERARQRLIREGFADRAYAPDGSLVPRGLPGAVLSDRDQIAEQVRRLAPTVDSICLHGDTPGCVELGELVHRTLLDAGYEVGA